MCTMGFDRLGTKSKIGGIEWCQIMAKDFSLGRIGILAWVDIKDWVEVWD